MYLHKIYVYAKNKIPNDSVAKFEVLLKSKQDYKIACRRGCILSLAKGNRCQVSQGCL